MFQLIYLLWKNRKAAAIWQVILVAVLAILVLVIGLYIMGKFGSKGTDIGSKFNPTSGGLG